MNKPVLTKQQAEAIESIKDTIREKLLDLRKNPHMFPEKEKSLVDIGIFKIEEALYDGYEVEPEVGDWVKFSYIDGKYDIGKVLELKEGYVIVDFASFEAPQHIMPTDLSNPTPSEIAEEKERRIWKKHGRDVWELKNGDVLVCDDYPRIVNKVVDFEEKTVIFSDKDWEYYENVAEEYEVVCFAEKRLDVKEHD